MSARNRAAYNWHILRAIGEQLRDVFKADLSRPMPAEMLELVDRLAQREGDHRAAREADCDRKPDLDLPPDP